jgi:D-3-phosphoglycerate dehydrogenase
MFTVLVTAPSLASEGAALLESAGCRTLYLKGEDGELARLMASEPIDAVISRTVNLDGAAIASCPTLKVISKHGAGVNNIDVASATRLGIPVFYTGGANAQSVAELTLGMALAIARDIPLHDRSLHDGGWTRSRIGIELSGRVLGVIGLGQIGSRVAALATAFGMQVLVYDPHIRNRGYAAVDRLDEFVTMIDLLTLHCPLTEETRGMIGAAELAALPPSGIVLNTARGEIVDEQALVSALSEGRLRGAGLDGFSVEPLPPGHPFLSLPNVLLTPHIGGSTQEALGSVASGAAASALAVLRGEPVDPALCVNPTTLVQPHIASAS